MEFLVNEAVEDYAFQSTTPEPALLQELIDETNKNMGWPQKLSGRLVGRTLKLLAQLHQPKNVLEIGPGLGFLTEKLLEAGANLTAIELDERAVKVLQKKFWQSCCQKLFLNNTK